MLAGENYNAFDPVLLAERQHAQRLLFRYNQLLPEQNQAKQIILDQLLGSHHQAHIEPQFLCDYGYNIHVGQRFYANFNCIILDSCPVHIGDDCLLGPGVQIYTACHPLDPAKRKAGIEYGKSVTMGHNVWIGGQAILLPGITIGDHTVIGAGSVVSRDVPAYHVVAGNPARIIRIINSEKEYSSV